MDHGTSLMLYKTLILPLFNYCDFVYHCLNQKDQSVLEKLQNSALRHIIQCRKLTPLRDMHGLCSMEYLSTRRDRHVSHEMFKISNKLSPLNLQNMFILTSEVHTRHTRGASYELYYVPTCKLETEKCKFRYRGAVNWNCLPPNISHATSLSVFKKECVEHYNDN